MCIDLSHVHALWIISGFVDCLDVNPSVTVLGKEKEMLVAVAKTIVGK